MQEALAYLRTIACRAIAEDVGHQDLTTEALAGHLGPVRAELIHRSGGVVAGLFCLPELLTAASRFLGLPERHRVLREVPEGSTVPPGEVIAEVEAEAAVLLPAERTVLNFLARLSGIATLTARFVRAVRGTRAEIYDTRKTTPLLRPLEKYAVRLGGGRNHRQGLFDQVLIKDNHLRLSGLSVRRAVAAARDYLRRQQLSSPVEVEVESLGELEGALSAGPDIVMLDNMPLEELRQAVALRDRLAPGVLLEVSGGITLENVRAVAETGVERISVGALTHSAPAADVALEFTSGRPSGGPAVPAGPGSG